MFIPEKKKREREIAPDLKKAERGPSPGLIFLFERTSLLLEPLKEWKCGQWGMEDGAFSTGGAVAGGEAELLGV